MIEILTRLQRFEIQLTCSNCARTRSAGADRIFENIYDSMSDPFVNKPKYTRETR